MSDISKRLARLRMSETGENYVTALRALGAMDAGQRAALLERDRLMRRRQQYPSTDRDGLSRQHVLSAMETNRSRH